MLSCTTRKKKGLSCGEVTRDSSAPKAHPFTAQNSERSRLPLPPLVQSPRGCRSLHLPLTIYLQHKEQVCQSETGTMGRQRHHPQMIPSPVRNATCMFPPQLQNDVRPPQAPSNADRPSLYPKQPGLSFRTLLSSCFLSNSGPVRPLAPEPDTRPVPTAQGRPSRHRAQPCGLHSTQLCVASGALSHLQAVARALL